MAADASVMPALPPEIGATALIAWFIFSRELRSGWAALSLGCSFCPGRASLCAGSEDTREFHARRQSD
jgi:hypothetical protein